MKLPAPRVIAIDDEQRDLNELTRALNRYGAACLPVLFSADVGVPRCPAVRVIFADLHLVPGPPEDSKRQFNLIASLIEGSIQPAGPYLAILWTQYPQKASELREFLDDRLEKVAKPFAVVPLDKSKFLEGGQLKSVDSLESAIDRVVSEQPQVAALLDWEARILDASAATIESIQALAIASGGTRDLHEELGSLLHSLADAVVGTEHVDADPFQAVNGALLPILADRLAASQSSDPDNQLWRAALKGSDPHQDLDPATVASLNRSLHFDMPPEPIRGDERGAVIALPEQYRGCGFKSTFGLDTGTAAVKQFACRELDDVASEGEWVLVQCQAACDYAQKQPGPIPFHLGLLLPEKRAKKGKAPLALWKSPCFDFNGERYFLHVNARFSLSLPRELAEAGQPVFRLREQLLNQVIHTVHCYGLRQGIISF